jgi:hypothetical protein
MGSEECHRIAGLADYQSQPNPDRPRPANPFYFKKFWTLETEHKLGILQSRQEVILMTDGRESEGAFQETYNYAGFDPDNGLYRCSEPHRDVANTTYWQQATKKWENSFVKAQKDEGLLSQRHIWFPDAC